MHSFICLSFSTAYIKFSFKRKQEKKVGGKERHIKKLNLEHFLISCSWCRLITWSHIYLPSIWGSPSWSSKFPNTSKAELKNLPTSLKELILSSKWGRSINTEWFSQISTSASNYSPNLAISNRQTCVDSHPQAFWLRQESWRVGVFWFAGLGMISGIIQL